MLALLVMRRTRPNHPRPYKCPLIIPILVLAISAYLIVAPIIDKPQIEYLYAAAFIGAGMFFYLPFVKYGYVPKFMGKPIKFQSTPIIPKPSNLIIIRLSTKKKKSFQRESMFSFKCFWKSHRLPPRTTDWLAFVKPTPVQPTTTPQSFHSMAVLVTTRLPSFYLSNIYFLFTIVALSSLARSPKNPIRIH